MSVRDWLPPVILRTLRRFRHGAPAREWEIAPHGWQTPVRGWNEESVAAAQARRWPAYVDAIGGSSPLTIARESDQGHVVDVIGHNAAMMFGYVLMVAGHGKQQLRILDWGGGLGHYAVLAKALVAGDIRVDPFVYDLPRLVEAGRRLNRDAAFFDDPSRALADRYDLVLASSSIWYASDWRAAVSAIAAVAPLLYICRMAFVFRSPSVVAIQRPVQGASYETEYLCWILNRGEFVSFVESLGFTLAREFFMEGGPSIHGLEEEPLYRGFLFRKEGHGVV